MFLQHSKSGIERNSDERDWVFWLGIGANMAQILDFAYTIGTAPFS